MVALKSDQFDKIAKTRPNYRGFLFYGTDEGLVKKRANLVSDLVLGDNPDPMNLVEITEEKLKETPSLIGDELAAISMFGGERVIRIIGSSITIVNAIKNLVTHLKSGAIAPNGIFIIEAGKLTKTSALMKIFTAEKDFAAVACYEKSAQDMQGYVSQALQDKALKITPEAMTMLMQLCGTQQGIVDQELEKLFLYKGAYSDQKSDITIEDVLACNANGAQIAAFDLPNFVASGNLPALSHAMHQAKIAGEAPMSILILTQRHFHKLQQAQLHMQSGLSAELALKKLYIQFPASQSMLQHLRKWNAPKTNQANAMLLKAEQDAKSTGSPVQEIIERVCLQLCMMAS